MAMYRKLGKTSSGRKALLKNQVTNLLYHGKIETTEARAKEVRKIAEKFITLAIKEKDNFEEVTVTAKVAKKDAEGKRVKEVVNGNKVTVFEEVQKTVRKDSASRLAARRKIMAYVYDLQDTLRGLRVDELNAEFEAKINILNHEVLTAQNKISSLKDANIQADFSDVYLNSLKNKRDTMIKEYNDTLQEITDRINQNLVQIAHEKNTPTIFNKQTIGAFTPDVIDITAEIVQRIQAEHINDMLK